MPVDAGNYMMYQFQRRYGAATFYYYIILVWRTFGFVSSIIS